MKHLILTISITLLSLSAIAQPRNERSCQDKKQRQEWRKEHCEKKISYIAEKMEITESEKEILRPIIENFQEQMRISHKKTHHARKSAKLENPSYELINEIIVKEDENIYNAKQKLHESLKKHFTAKQIFIFYEAEHNFNRLLIKEIEKREKK